MIGICNKCGNHEWDKEVRDNKIFCPKCGNSWEFIKLPLFILTGCSGVGKTTTAMEIIRRKVDFTVLDGDMFFNIMPHETEEDYYEQVEQIGSLSKNLMQTGKPVLWAMAGNLDKLHRTYNSRFFQEIYCLALVCNEEVLRTRMQDGRGIRDAEWIQSSVDYNKYFKTYRQIGDMRFEIYDISEKSPAETADYVIEWVRALKDRMAFSLTKD